HPVVPSAHAQFHKPPARSRGARPAPSVFPASGKQDRRQDASRQHGGSLMSQERRALPVFLAAKKATEGADSYSTASCEIPSDFFTSMKTAQECRDRHSKGRKKEGGWRAGDKKGRTKDPPFSSQ